MTPTVTIREALTDPRLLGKEIGGDSWRAWRILLIAAMGEKLTNDERKIFTKLTGREHEPLERVSELVAVVGRRGGKSRAMAILLVYLAALCDHRACLVPGETGVALCISKDTKVAKVILDYAHAALKGSKVLRHLVANRTQDTLELSNGVNIEVRPASFRSLRGPTYIAVVADEVAYWFTDVAFANPDVEILTACRPGLLTTGGPLILASSPYAKAGELYDRYRRYYGKDGDADTLVALGTSRDLNPTLSQKIIDRELEKDPVRNRAEYLAEFRDDLEGFIPREVVERCIGDFYELPPQSGVSYRAFVDAASGVRGGDSYTLAIAHRHQNQVIVDCVREFIPPFDADVVVKEFCALCRSYGIHKVVGDNFAGDFAKTPYVKAGLTYEPAKKHKSEQYRDALPLLNSLRVTLPRNERLINQICSLERSTKRSGREEITHALNGHDDLANAALGAVVAAHTYGAYTDLNWVDTDADAELSKEEQEAEMREWERERYFDYIASGAYRRPW